MRLVVQRVLEASCSVNGEIVSEIKQGLLIFLGVCTDYNPQDIEYFARKCLELRIFCDELDKMNLSVKDINGEILLISQFTLCAKTKRGRRPDFTSAANADLAKKVYLDFSDALEKLGIIPKLGIFAANMKISLINDGPVTIILER
ncbi:MAG: D-aminoacyl-tRNA deacylase [Candidatus Cloacimonetes bacterium]|nr:D-aminoacyl-tRNA deacylase [Candidatus Cloacimonadota bacterium]